MFKILVDNGKVNGDTLWRFYPEEYETLEDLIEELIGFVLNSGNKISDYKIVETVTFEGRFKVQWEDMKKD